MFCAMNILCQSNKQKKCSEAQSEVLLLDRRNHMLPRGLRRNSWGVVKAQEMSLLHMALFKKPRFS